MFPSNRHGSQRASRSSALFAALLTIRFIGAGPRDPPRPAATLLSDCIQSQSLLNHSSPSFSSQFSPRNPCSSRLIDAVSSVDFGEEVYWKPWKTSALLTWDQIASLSLKNKLLLSAAMSGHMMVNTYNIGRPSHFEVCMFYNLCQVAYALHKK